MQGAIAANPFADKGVIEVYPPGLWEPVRSRRLELGEAMDTLLGIALVALERGRATCMEAAWAVRATTVCASLGLPEGERL